MQYLRTGTTWSALALTYGNSQGQAAVLVQLFWLRGNANGSTDVKRHYLIFERPFDLREIKDFDLDVRKLKKSYPEAFAREDFQPYRERFCRLLGIESEQALRLLHKTQSAKNLGDLNTFLRDFMLDRPETFDAAERLVSEFEELNAAHQAVVTAREQVSTLAPARDGHGQLQDLILKQDQLKEVKTGVDGYKETCRLALLQERIAALHIELAGARAEGQQRQTALDNERAALDDLKQQHRELGGRPHRTPGDREGRVGAESRRTFAQTGAGGNWLQEARLGGAGNAAPFCRNGGAAAARGRELAGTARQAPAATVRPGQPEGGEGEGVPGGRGRSQSAAAPAIEYSGIHARFAHCDYADARAGGYGSSICGRVARGGPAGGRLAWRHRARTSRFCALTAGGGALLFGGFRLCQRSASRRAAGLFSRGARGRIRGAAHLCQLDLPQAADSGRRFCPMAGADLKHRFDYA